MSLGDFEFLAFGVARQPQNLETILQGRRNRVQHVRRRDKENLREIVLDVEVVILEHVILFRIEHFEQGRARIAAEIRAELVDFIQQQHGIHRAGFLHHLNDLTGQRANVGATMTANLSFIAHAAQRQAHKLATGGAGDRFAETRLADSRRADKAED
jgi:hypothetical protein